MQEVIYGMTDPITGELRYIGRTRQPLILRLQSHVHDARRHKSQGTRIVWLRELLAAGVRPDIFEIERVETATRTDAELFWVDYYRSIGARLVNERRPHDGGDRSHIVTWTPELDARLGKEADSIIAEELGVTRKTVTYRRNVLGIPASFDRTRNTPPPPRGGWNKVELPAGIIKRFGTMPDYLLAAEAGVSKTRIMRERQRLGIPSYAEQTGNTGRYQEGNFPARWLLQNER